MYQIGEMFKTPIFAWTSSQTKANVFSAVFSGCMKLTKLCGDQAEWSQATFGDDSERGPVGPLKHLALEAVEAQENPKDLAEYADCFLLILDASRRAGYSIGDLIEGAVQKQSANEKRTWPKPTGDTPVFHNKE